MHFFLFHLLSFKGKDSNCTTQDYVKYLTKHLGELRRPEGVGRWKGRGDTDTCLVKNSAAVKLKDPLTFFYAKTQMAISFQLLMETFIAPVAASD